MFQTAQLLQVTVHLHLAGFVFFATLCSYNFHYILAGAMAGKKLSMALFIARPSATLAFITGALGALFFFLFSGITTGNLLTAILLTITYSIPLLPFRQLDVARKAGFLKTVLLAYTWMYVTAYLPMAQYHLQFSVLGILIMAKRFLFMLMLCIIFDNRDVKIDAINGLHSLATDLSPKLMEVLIYFIFILLFILNFFIGKYGVGSMQVVALQLSAMATLAVYFFSRQKQGYIFYYFVVDGMMILMTALTSIVSI